MVDITVNGVQTPVSESLSWLEINNSLSVFVNKILSDKNVPMPKRMHFIRGIINWSGSYFSCTNWCWPSEQHHSHLEAEAQLWFIDVGTSNTTTTVCTDSSATPSFYMVSVWWLLSYHQNITNVFFSSFAPFCAWEFCKQKFVWCPLSEFDI